jgi:fructose-bisphosphate aldolase class II
LEKYMLTTLREVLGDARKNHYAVPAFDCVEDVMVRAILETCQARRSPALLMVLEPDVRGNGWHYVSGLVKGVASHHDLPVVLHLDHATELDSIRKALDLGFTSVMIDGSSLPFAENVRLTRSAVELARPQGVSVEAELGHVGGMDLEETACAESQLTESGEVTRFVAETGVDALAVSIGTQHGVYRCLPTLNIERLKELNAASPVPLVLHGGSGTPDDQIRESVRHGVCKLNIYADCRMGMRRGLDRAAAAMKRPDPLPYEIFGPIREEVAAVVAQKIELLGAANRV